MKKSISNLNMFKVLFLPSAFFCLLSTGTSFGQQNILRKMIVTGPEENIMAIGEPNKVLLRVNSTIKDLSFESSKSKELAVYKQGESAYNVYLPEGRQYVTIFAEGFQNYEFSHTFQENKAYLLEVELAPIEPAQVQLPDTLSLPVNREPVFKASSSWKKQRNIGLIGFVATGAVAGYFKISADQSYDSYLSARSADEAQKFRDETEQKDLIWTVSSIVSGALFSYAIFSWLKI